MLVVCSTSMHFFFLLPSSVLSNSQTKHTTRSGRQLTVTIQAWHQMLMRGTKTEKMYCYPFTLMRISVADDTLKLVWKPMWLIVMGDRREEISPLVAYQSYRERYGIEHLFRFGKQRLLMTQFQTPELELAPSRLTH